MELNEIMKKFVEQKKIEIPHLKAVLFYGSSCYKTNTAHSDIDLLLITAHGSTMRGKKIVEGHQIDYTIKSVATLEQDCMTSLAKQETFLLSIFQNGKIIYNEDRIIEKFQKYFLLRHKNKLPTYEINRQEKECLQRMWSELINVKNAKFFEVIYYNLLNRIRIDYQNMSGCSRIPISKVYSFYQNRAYAEKYYCSVLPSEDFTNQFIQSITATKEEQKRNEIQNYGSLFTIEFLDKKRSSTNFNMRKENFYQTPKMNDLKISAIPLISKYNQAIIALQENKPDANYLYYIVLEQLRRFYEIQCGVLNTYMENVSVNYQDSLQKIGLSILDPDFIAAYFQAITVKENQEKIKCLDKIYTFALRDVPISTNEYLITLQKSR